MTPVLAPGQGPMAVHRWFARGEDWAMHPWFAPRIGEVLRALDDRIKGRQQGPFQLDAAGGVLAGELLDDSACLDPRAEGRRPCVVRLAFVAGPLSYREQEAVLAALRGVPLPDAPGLDQGLVVGVPQVQPSARPAAKTGEEAPRRVSGLWPVVIALVLLVVALIAGKLWLDSGNGTKDKDKEKRPDKSKPADPPTGLKALLERYSRVDHPALAFLRAHPEALERSRRSREPSYEEWLAGQGRAFRHAGRPVPRRLRERLALWRELDPPLADAAQRLRALRKKWGGADVPTLADEFDAFFEAVVRPEGLPPRDELDHPGNAFLLRLPRDPVAAGEVFSSEEELRRALSALAAMLGATGQPSTSADAVAQIRSALDYKAWLDDQKYRGAAFADEDDEPGTAVAEGLKRFGGP